MHALVIKDKEHTQVKELIATKQSTSSDLPNSVNMRTINTRQPLPSVKHLPNQHRGRRAGPPPPPPVDLHQNARSPRLP